MKRVALLASLFALSWSSQAAPARASTTATATCIPRDRWATFIARADPRFVPNARAGRIVSVRLFMGPRSSLRELGLKGGENLTAVNGRSLVGHDDAPAMILSELESSAQTCSLSLTFEAGAQSRTIRAGCAVGVLV